MTIENVEKFYEEAQKRTELSDQLKKADSPDSFIKLACEIGGENGFIFTPQDVADVLEQKKTEVELNSEDLEVVAGGKAPVCPFETSLTCCRIKTGCFDSFC